MPGSFALAGRSLRVRKRSRVAGAAALALLLAVLAVLPGASARAIDNGVVQVGIHPGAGSGLGEGPVAGTLPQTPSLGGAVNVGLRFLTDVADATGYEALLANDRYQWGWGVAYTSNGATVAGHCNQGMNLSACPAGAHAGPAPACTATHCVQTSWVGVQADLLRVDHEWAPAANEPSAYRTNVTLENPGDDPRTAVVYRRLVDWNVEPSPQNEYLEIQGIAPMPPALRFLGADGKGSADPRVALAATGCVAPLSYVTVAACGRGDRGFAVEFDLGTILPDESRSFCMFHGAAASKGAAEAVLRRLPVELYSLALTDPTGAPATFFLGYGCLTPPVADVDWTPGAACATAPPSQGGPVTFTDRSRTRTVGLLPPMATRIQFGDGSDALIAGGTSVAHAYAQPGTYNVTVTTMTDDGRSATLVRSLTVADCSTPPPDLPPVITPMQDRAELEGRLVTLAVVGMDPEGEPIRYSALGLPAGASFDAQTGAFTWAAQDPRRHCMVFRVEETGDPTHFDETPMCITVRAAGTGLPAATDPDLDGVAGSADNCPTAYNPDQADADADGVGDLCDLGDDPSGTGAVGTGTDGGDDLPEAALADADGDGVADADDSCPEAPNRSQRDYDRDGLGDVCDLDLDDDGVPQVDLRDHLLDNCPFTPNPEQADTNEDGVGDACTGDRDGDGVADLADNCLWIANTDQADADADGTGDACASFPFLAGRPILMDEPEEDLPTQDTTDLENGAVAVVRGLPTWPVWVLVGAAGALVVASAVKERRRWLPLLVPLFTRIKKDEVLEHPVRQRILDLVEANPGLHYRALVRGVDKGKGTVEYHLRILEDHGYVRTHRAGGYVTYYPAGHSRDAMEAQSVLRSDTARKLLQAVLATPGATVAQLAERMGLSYGAVSHHVKRFEDAGLVTVDKLPGGARTTPTAMAWQALGAEPLLVGGA